MKFVKPYRGRSPDLRSCRRGLQPRWHPDPFSAYKLFSAIPVGADHSYETIKMVKARGCELLAVTQMKLGVELRDFGLTIGILV
jgi:hypothetical protein